MATLKLLKASSDNTGDSAKELQLFGGVEETYGECGRNSEYFP